MYDPYLKVSISAVVPKGVSSERQLHLIIVELCMRSEIEIKGGGLKNTKARSPISNAVI